MILALLALLVVLAGALASARRGRTAVYETPAHLYPSALVADEDAGDAPEFVLPADLTAAEVSDDDLATLEAQAVQAFDDIYEGNVEGGTATLATLADAIDLVRAEAERRMTAAAEDAAQAATLAGRVHGEPAAESEGEGEGEPEGEPDAGAAVTVEPEPVTASSGRPAGALRIPLGRIRDRAPEPVHAGNGFPEGVAIVAASDVPGAAGGSHVADTSTLARLMHNRTRGLGEGGSALVASIEVTYDHVVDDTSTKDNMRDAMDAARNPAGLVAAGGWCAPSDRLWDFFSIEDTGGLLDLPTVGVNRGGLEWPVSPSIGDVFNVPWLWTEADDIAALGNPHPAPADDRVKPCFRIPCGTWDEARLRAHGVCLTHGNLSNEAWPEQTRRYVDLVMAAHAHVMAGRNIARMVALSTAVNIPVTAGALAPVLSAIELQVADYRDKYRMGDSVLLEGVFDAWVPGLLRADFSRRAGVDLEDIPNSRIAQWFTDRGVRPQFVHNFHPLQTGGVGVDGFRETWPTQVSFLLYAAGTFVRGTGPTIDLGVVRDSGLNSTNDHTAVWTEETDLIAKFGHESRLVNVTVCPNGSTSPPHALLACPIP